MLMRDDSEKAIHTGLYSDRAFAILNAIRDAYGSSVSESNSVTQFKSASVVHAPDNEILLVRRNKKVSISRGSIWCKENNDALKWIGIALKTYVCDENLDITWNRASNAKVEIKFYRLDSKGRVPYDAKEQKMTATVAEIYFIYDSFLQRKKLDRKYDKALIDMMVGTPNDPITTEIEIARREELKKLDDQLLVDLDSIRAKYNEERDAIAHKFNEECSVLSVKKREALIRRREEYDAQRKALLLQYAEMAP